MAHFAELDSNNIVQRVIVVGNDVLKDATGQENEELGKAFCQSLLGGNWVQTSYNGNIRGRYAGIGYYFNEEENEFYPHPCKNRSDYEASIASSLASVSSQQT
jgi:hypothetical protein